MDTTVQLSNKRASLLMRGKGIWRRITSVIDLQPVAIGQSQVGKVIVIKKENGALRIYLTLSTNPETDEIFATMVVQENPSGGQNQRGVATPHP